MKDDIYKPSEDARARAKKFIAQLEAKKQSRSVRLMEEWLKPLRLRDSLCTHERTFTVIRDTTEIDDLAIEGSRETHCANCKRCLSVS